MSRPRTDLCARRQRRDVVHRISEARLERDTDALGEAARVALHPMEVDEHAAAEVDLDVGARELVRVARGAVPVGDDGGEVADIAVARLIVLEVGQKDERALPPRLLQRPLHQNAVTWLEKMKAHRRLQLRMLVVEEDGAHERLRAVVRVGIVGAHWAAAPVAEAARATPATIAATPRRRGSASCRVRRADTAGARLSTPSKLAVSFSSPLLSYLLSSAPFIPDPSPLDGRDVPGGRG